MKLFTIALLSFLALLPIVSFSQTANFTISTEGSIYCHPKRVLVTQQCTGEPRAFVWDFGNGERGLNASEIIYYDTSGTFTIKLTAVYATTAVTVSKTITINQTPTVTLTADKSLLCVPGVVSFTANGSSNISQYQWDFGDATIDNEGGRAIQHNYNDYGNYNAKVKVTTTQGCIAESNYNININKFGITATVMPNNGCIPATASLGVSTILPPGEIAISYTWFFGDGTPAINNNDSAMSHIYNTTDSIYNASVSVNTNGGCSNKITFAPFAYGTPPVNTTIATVLAVDSFCASETIKFTSYAPTANLYKWQFGDSSENSSPDTTISYKYRSLGKKNVVAIPSFNGCEGERDSISIFIKGVVANFDYGNQCGRKNDYWFTNGSIGNVSKFVWKFETNNITRDSVNYNASYLFPTQATSKATLYLFDNTTGCTDETAYNIYTAVPLMNRDMTSVCKDSSINYSVLSTYPDSAGYMYRYYVCGDSVSNGNNSTLVYNPANHGSFTDYVVIEDAVKGTCSDSLFLNSNTIVRGPVVNFTTQIRTCTGKPFIFDNSSYPFFNTDAINNWQWNFGDSSASNVKDAPQHIYKKAGLYSISLTATDINGCGSTHQQDILSDRLPQIISFPERDTICSGKDSVLLTAYTIDTLVWLPPTNISCNNCDSTMVFPTRSTYYVAQATNRFGCSSYDTTEIKVYAPMSLKVFPADTSICPGQTINYRLNTEGIVTWQPAAWLSNTNTANPIATPLQDTFYTVTIQDSVGCFTDTAIAKVHVFDLPTVNAGPDITLPYNAPFTLTPSYSPGVVSYTWAPGKSLTCYNCANPSGNAAGAGTYSITVANANGCTAKDNINIIVKCDKGNLILPTAFSPDGNSRNDYFYPIARGYKNIRKFVIFNRLGNKVFERQNFLPNTPSNGWDGIIRGAETVSSTESYVWFIEAECEQGEIVQNKGTVMLVK